MDDARDKSFWGSSLCVIYSLSIVHKNQPPRGWFLFIHVLEEKVMWDGSMLAGINAQAEREELERRKNRTVVIVVMVPPDKVDSSQLPQGRQVRLTRLCECCQATVLDALSQ